MPDLARVVKIGYLEPDLYDMAADWMLMLTPGGVDQDTCSAWATTA